MNNHKLILMKGISCAGKSTIVEELKQEENTIILSSDSLRESLGLEKTDNSVFDMINKMAHDYLNQGKTVVIDSTNLTHKRHTHYREIARKHGVEYVCYYVITHPQIWEENAQVRIETKWKDTSMDKMLNIRQKMYMGLCFPMRKEFDSVVYRFVTPSVNPHSLNFFKHYYNENKELFLTKTEEFFEPLKRCGYLEDVFPELFAIYGVDQENEHHTLTLDKHTFKVCENLKEKNEANVWSALLHDLGKMTKGIKQQKENGGCTYIGHHGASTEIAFCVMNRLGFPIEMIEEVCLLVNKHMLLPYEGTLKPRTIDFLGQDLYQKLIAFREADKNAK